MKQVDKFIVLPMFFPEAKIIIADVWNQTTPLCGAVWTDLLNSFKFKKKPYSSNMISYIQSEYHSKILPLPIHGNRFSMIPLYYRTILRFVNFPQGQNVKLL